VDISVNFHGNVHLHRWNTIETYHHGNFSKFPSSTLEMSIPDRRMCMSTWYTPPIIHEGGRETPEVLYYVVITPDTHLSPRPSLWIYLSNRVLVRSQGYAHILVELEKRMVSCSVRRSYKYDVSINAKIKKTTTDGRTDGRTTGIGLTDWMDGWMVQRGVAAPLYCCTVHG